MSVLVTDSSTTGPTDPAGVTGQLSEWIAGLALTDAPAGLIEHAKNIILDSLGCALVGARLPWSVTAVEAMLRFEGAGPAPLIGWGRALSAPAAALLNGTFIQGFELDDFHPKAPLHSGSLVLPALLAAAALKETPYDGRRFLLAAITGFEVGPRVGMGLHGIDMLTRGWHSGAVFGTHAAGAAVAKLHGLDAARVEDTLGMAGTQSAGLMAAQFEAMCKRMHHGLSSRAGLTAALLAEGGYTGIKRVYERDYGGFLSVFGEGHDPDPGAIVANLGSEWLANGIVLKPYAAMGGLHAPLDAILAIRARRFFRPNEIARIEIELAGAAYHHGWWQPERPLTPIGAQMNVGYAVAVAAIDGAAMVAQFAPSRIDADDVWALLPKIEVRHDHALDANRETRLSTRMTVTFADGSQEREHVAAPRTVAAPLDRAAVIEKFRTLTSGIMAGQRIEHIIDMVMTMEHLADIHGLQVLLQAEVRSPFAIGQGGA